MAELAALENVTAGYGEGRVLDEVTVAVEEGGSLALLGRNGVGKAPLLVTLMIGIPVTRESRELFRRIAQLAPAPIGVGLEKRPNRR